MRTVPQHRLIELTNDALFQVLVETEVADLLKQERVKLLKCFEVLQMSVDHVQVFARTVCRSVLHTRYAAF